MQLGFDLDWVDPKTKELPSFVKAEDVKKVLDILEAQSIAVTDTETTGLNPTCEEQVFSGKDLRSGVDPSLRVRVVSMLYFDGNERKKVAFDLDKMSAQNRSRLARVAVDGKVFIAHNGGFDLFWLRELAPGATPKVVIDSMLLSRILFKQHPLVLAAMANDSTLDEALRAEAEAVLVKIAKSGGGWSLAALSLSVLQRILPKDFQGPKNWCMPFLSEDSYKYATDDVGITFDILLKVLGLPEDATLESLYSAYQAARAANPAIAMQEPQIMDIVHMREKGMPWSVVSAEAYYEKKAEEVQKYADRLVELDSRFAKHRHSLASMSEGVKADLKTLIGQIFMEKGLTLEYTAKTGVAKIGEKDLRKVKAQVNLDAKPLFDAWVGLNKAKKTGNMAKEVSNYAKRSKDGRLHPNTGHGPATGRLASSEPNCQQFPRDQFFRDCVRAAFGFKMVFVDFSALDVRVGAALAIRAQGEIFEAYLGDRKVAEDLRKAIVRVVEKRCTLFQTEREAQEATKRFQEHKAGIDEVGEDGKKSFWEKYRKLQRLMTLAKFTYRYKQVRDKADANGEATWGALREFFAIPGLDDIHSWTTLKMRGRDPNAEIEGMTPKEAGEWLKGEKKKLGDARTAGKVANLALLYAMQVLGFLDFAAKIHNIHWTWEEGSQIREQWLDAYPEIELWHLWTEMTPQGEVYMPDPEKGNRYVRKSIFESVTLGDRSIYTFGINAALAYQDQSTGADILGVVMDTLHREHPAVFDGIVNQIHDEIGFELPEDKAEEYAEIIRKVMVETAERFLMPYGVHAECSPAIGDTWLKD